MPFLPPNQQRQSTEGKHGDWMIEKAEFIIKLGGSDWRIEKAVMTSHTEHRSLTVCTQPEPSFSTQHELLRSTCRSDAIASRTLLSSRMHGEYLAPRWIRSACKPPAPLYQISHAKLTTLMIMPKLWLTYRGRIIYKTPYEDRRAFLRYDSLAKLQDRPRQCSQISLRYSEEKS